MSAFAGDNEAVKHRPPAPVAEEQLDPLSRQSLEEYGDRTIGQMIRRHAELCPAQAAIVSSQFAPLTYRELQTQIDGIGAALRNAGFDKNARIIVALSNGPQAALAIIAIACSAIAVPLDPNLTLPELETRLALLRPDAILLLQGSDSAARQVAQQHGLTLIEAINEEGKLGCRFVTPQLEPAAIRDASDPDPNAPAVMLQTSGTTADVKSIPLSHRNVVVFAHRIAASFRLTTRDRCLCVIPVYYGQGLRLAVLTPLLAGGSVAFPLDVADLDVSEWLDHLAPTWYAAAPTLHLAMLEAAKSRPTMHSLRFILSGGAALPNDVHEGLAAVLGVPVLQYYGGTEVGFVSANHIPPGPSKQGTCGIPWPDTIAIVGEDGHRRPSGEIGEILIGGPGVISGYLNAPELQEATFVDGWFRTGDIGSLDAEGFLTLHGRLSEFINRGGEKIAPLEIEHALMRHPDVAEAAAFGMPHARLGEDVAAAVVLHPGAVVTPGELRELLSGQLAAFKIPRRIIVLDHLPKGPTGKVQRQRLNEIIKAMPARLPSTDISSSPPKTESISTLQSELLQLWSRYLHDPALTVDDDLFESGADSLLATKVLLEVSRLTGQAVPTSILFETSTVRKLAKRLSAAGALQPEPVFKIGSGSSESPLLFFHGDLFGGFFVRNLARVLGPELPIIAIAPHGVGNETIPESIEDMAADRLQTLLKFQPLGPYRLAGVCNGALVAFETARLLVTGGHNVELVALIDPVSINASRSAQIILSMVQRMVARSDRRQALVGWVWRRLADCEELSMMSWAQRELYVRHRIGALLPRMLRPKAAVVRNGRPGTLPQIIGPMDVPPDLEKPEILARNQKYRNTMAAYRPAPLDVPVIYFSSVFDGRPWRRISPDLEVIRRPGDHFAWVEKDVVLFKQALLNRLQNANKHAARVDALSPA
jgi:oxalate---CoA ligase